MKHQVMSETLQFFSVVSNKCPAKKVNVAVREHSVVQKVSIPELHQHLFSFIDIQVLVDRLVRGASTRQKAVSWAGLHLARRGGDFTKTAFTTTTVRTSLWRLCMHPIDGSSSLSSLLSPGSIAPPPIR